jgi:hypothetical protein
MTSFLKFMVEWGVWDITSFCFTLVPLALIIIYLFPRKGVTNFYIDAQVTSHEQFSRVIAVRLTNHTNTPLYVLSEGFKFGSTIRPSPHAAKDAATARYEIKFEGRQRGVLSDIDVLVRPNEAVSTLIPLHPDERPESVQKSIDQHQVGYLFLRVQQISTRPHPFTRLTIKI